MQAVAFYAKSTTTVTKFNVGSVLKFNNAITNTGGAYNPSNGTFTSPIGGHYAFSWNIVCTPAKTGNLADVFLMLNGQLQGIAQADCRDQNGSGSDTVVLKLNKGDVVHLELHGSNVPRLQVYGDGYSSFSGWLIPYM